MFSANIVMVTIHMMIDCHTHIFPADIRQNRTPFFAFEPDFELLYKPHKARLAGTQDILDHMDAHHIERSVVFGFPWRSAEMFQRHNDYIMAVVARYPNRFIGLACMDVCHLKAPDEALRCLDGGLRGVGELAFYQGGMDTECRDNLHPIMALCRERQVPVMIHTNEPVGHEYSGKAPMTLKEIHQLIKRFRQNTIILAHWGGGIFFYGLLKKEMTADLANVYFDTAASPYLYQPSVYPTAANIIGEDKILLGTDYPLLPASRYLEEIKASGLDQNAISKIVGQNTATLFGVASF